MQPTRGRINYTGTGHQGQSRGRVYAQRAAGAARRESAEDRELAQHCKDYQERLFKSALALVRLPGGYPICYAFGCEDCLVTDYAEWNAYRDACYKEARAQVYKEINDENPEAGAPFTWGFRKFPKGNYFSIEQPGPLMWVLAFVKTNIWNHEIPRRKFKAWCDAKADKLRRTVYFADRIRYTEESVDVVSNLQDANSPGARLRYETVLGQLFAMFEEADPASDIEDVHWQLLIAMLIYPSARAPNYSPGELSEFYRANPDGDGHTSNLKFDQSTPRALDARIERLERRAGAAQEQLERARRNPVGFLTPSASDAEGDAEEEDA